MDTWKALEPVRLHQPATPPPTTTSLASSFLNRSSRPSHTQPSSINLKVPYIGPLPVTIHLDILRYVPISSIPAYARASKSFALLARSESIWEDKCKMLGIIKPPKDKPNTPGGMATPVPTSLGAILDVLESSKERQSASKLSSSPPVMAVVEEDEFGDFASASLSSSSRVPASNSLSSGFSSPPSFSSSTNFEMGNFVGGSPQPQQRPFSFIAPMRPTSQYSSLSRPQSLNLNLPPQTNTNYRVQFIRAHNLLRPLLPALLSPAHLILSNIFPTDITSPRANRTSNSHSRTKSSSSSSAPTATSDPTSLRYQSKLLHLLALFLSPNLQAVSNHAQLLTALRSAIDRFEAALLTAFDAADTVVGPKAAPDDTETVLRKEKAMRDAAWASWEVYEGVAIASFRNEITAAGVLGFGRGGSSAKPMGGDWELGKVWAEKKEIFYESGKYDPLKNLGPNGILDFGPMDDFMNHILNALRFHGATAVRVFPPGSGVLLAFADRLALDVVGEYIAPLLSQARSVSNEVFLKATAATFVQAWRMIDVLIEVATADVSEARSPTSPVIEKGKDGKSDQDYGGILTKYQAQDVVFRMFEPNMDEYLDEEIDSLKQALENICKGWERQLNQTAGNAATSPIDNSSQARFLTSHNPAQVKRTVLASFTDVLLLPVTIVPRTMGVIGSGMGAIGSGMGALAESGAAGVVSGINMLNPQRWGGQGGAGSGGRADGYGAMGPGGGANEDMGGALFEIGDDDEEEDDWKAPAKKTESLPQKSVASSKRDSLAPTISSESTRSVETTTSATTSTTTATNGKSDKSSYAHLQLLLSLDVALEIIHASRESLKRTETFQHYPGHYGHKVRETIEELFILMLQALSERHIGPGFARATEQMRTYKPAEHEETASVAPLMQFFELVHIGDMMQSMVQVYFDKELAPHIDRTDFLNGVVREKKRFENTLDDSVAAGLNAGTEALMNQVEHIIMLRTGAREYYPVEGAPLDLGPTRGCTEAIACLETHCKLLKGSTSKEVLEVFYQEVGIRLDGIIQKHLKRQIISLEGGFQVIADLNAYHGFISSLKVPAITADFNNLKMLGHVFIVSDAKDLAQIVRDVTRYGGSFRPEDVYEFIQRRSDWKKIEKTVDKTMYNLSFKEDCVIC